MVTLSAQQLRRWKAVCHNGLHNGADLKSNETSFLTDMAARFEKYQQEAYLSDKQEDWLEYIETKLTQQLGAEYED